MPMWCLQSNECIACTGGCVGYESEREAMREARADFWRRVCELPEIKSAMDTTWSGGRLPLAT